MESLFNNYRVPLQASFGLTVTSCLDKVGYVGLTLRRYRSTISRPQEVHRVFPCREATVGTEEDEDEESEDGE